MVTITANISFEKKMYETLLSITKKISFVETMGYETHFKKLSFPSKINPYPINTLDFLESWAASSEQPYCALLGEYGMGKTTTCLWFAKRLLEKRQHDLSLPIPIYMDLRLTTVKLISDEINLTDLIDRLLCQGVFKHIPDDQKIDAKTLVSWVQEGRILIIFDGLDEVLVHLSIAEGQRLTRKLMSVLSKKPASQHKKPKGSLLVSCRTHFFRTLREQKTHFTQEDRGGIHSDDFKAIELLPFTQNQVRSYLIKSAPDINTDALITLIRSVHNLFELTERPFTLSLIPDLVPYIEQWKKEQQRITTVTIYRRVIQSWLERDIGKHTLTIEHKKILMEHLAAAFWKSGQKSWSITRLENWLVPFLNKHLALKINNVLQEHENVFFLIIEILKEDVRTATFLIREGEDHFRFAHASLQEFFLASYLYKALLEENYQAKIAALNL